MDTQVPDKQPANDDAEQRERDITERKQRAFEFYLDFELEAAWREYSFLAAAHPGEPDGHVGCGLVHVWLHRFAAAVECFSAAIRLKPGDHGLYEERAAAYYNLGDYEQAIADYSRAIELAPRVTYLSAAGIRLSQAGSYAERARAYAALGQTVKAEADKQKARELRKQRKGD